ncbi:MAG: chondroitinase-B domain-containing protein [Puniceicoccaceae bacterium]
MNAPITHLKRNVLVMTLLAAGAIGSSLLGQGVLFETDFESDTAGAQPSGPWTFSPSSNNATNGSVIVDAGTSPANPMTGKSLYVYDQKGDGSSGDPTHVRRDINDGVNVSAARVSFDFRRMYEASDSDTRVHFSIGPSGLSLNSSSNRLFEARVYNNADIRIEYSRDGAGGDRGSTVVATYDPNVTNTMVVFVNSHSSESASYDDGVRTGTLLPNMLDLWINDSYIGSYLTLDMQGAWASDADLGQIAFYQDSKRQGGIVFDNILVEELGSGSSGGGGSGEPQVFIDNLDFEDMTAGNQPIMPFATAFSPSSNSANNGFQVVDDTTTQVNPMGSGKALYAYDFDGNLVSGSPSHMRFDFAPTNTDNIRVDFDFQRAYATDESDTDTHINIGVAYSGNETNNSDFRPFRIFITNGGKLYVEYNVAATELEGRSSVEVATYMTSGVNHLTFFANGNNTTSLDYSDATLGDGTVPPNTMVLFLNEVKIGEYLFVNTADPSNAPQIKFWETDKDFGRFGIFQDSKRQGGVVFDNLSIQEFSSVPAPDAPSGLTAQATGANSISLSWTDNSDNETGFVIEILDGASWVELGQVDVDVTNYSVTGLTSETEYSFRVRSTNGVYSEPSNEAAATTEVQLVPQILVEPTGTVIPSGSNATLTVAASGPGVLSYRWYEGQSGDTSSPVSGGTQTTLETDDLTSTTSYWVRVSNANGSVDSTTATVEVFEPRNIRVVNLDQLSALLPSALPGDTYILDNGIYNNEGIKFEATGTEKAPITLRAETPGGVLLTGDSYIEVGGSWLVLSGFVLTDGWNDSRDSAISFRAGGSRVANNCRITNCAIIDFSPPDSSIDRDWVAFYGQYNRFDHNLLSGHSNKGVTMVVWRTNNKRDYHMIDHNHFRNRGSGGGENGWETIRVGTSSDSLSPSNTIVEYNLFESCDGEIEIISNKSGENIYRYNTFWKSQGMLTLRHGNDCVVEGNYFLGEGRSNTGGIRVIGERHTVINNYIERTTGRDDAAITVYAGVPNSPLNQYYAAHDAVVAHNTIVDVTNGHIELGAGYPDRDRTVLPTGVVIANNLHAQVLTSSTSTDGPAVFGQAVNDPVYQGNMLSGVFSPLMSTGFATETVNFETGYYGVLRPVEGSPVVDASVNSILDLDLDGQSRDGMPDVGADELVSTSGLNTGGPVLPLDTGPDYREFVDPTPPWIGPAIKTGRNLTSAWFGDFALGGSDWMYQSDLGWLDVDAIDSTDDMWFYSVDLGKWLWSSNACFPFFYDPVDAKWIYYPSVESGPSDV